MRTFVEGLATAGLVLLAILAIAYLLGQDED